MQGRKAVEVPELHAGDLGAVAKLRETLTGDTLGAKGAEVQIDLFPLPDVYKRQGENEAKCAWALCCRLAFGPWPV